MCKICGVETWKSCPAILFDALDVKRKKEKKKKKNLVFNSAKPKVGLVASSATLQCAA